MARKAKTKARRKPERARERPKAPRIVAELESEPLRGSRTVAAIESSVGTPGASARIRMGAPAPVTGQGAPIEETAKGEKPGPPIAVVPLEQQAREKLEQVFSPEVTAMLVEVAFGVAAVATGEPEIWQVSDDEIKPLAPGIGRQLSRIPVVRAIGPDNTELGIVVLGLGVMVTRRLNETAAKKQAEREEGKRPARSTAAEAIRIDPATANLLEGDEASEPHFGMRVPAVH